MSRPPLAFHVVRALGKCLFRGALNITVEGKENIPEKAPYILISNHLNWSDPFIYYTLFPAVPKLCFVAEFFGSYDDKYKRAFIDFVGKPIIPFDRDNPSDRVRVTKAMMNVLREGNVLGVFPEGRIGHREGDLFPFYVGAFTVAKKRNVPVLPVAISGTHNLSLRKPVHIRIGKQAFCGAQETDEDFARRMALTVKNLLPPYPGDGPYPHTWNWMTGLCQGELRAFTGERDLIIRTRKDTEQA